MALPETVVEASEPAAPFFEMSGVSKSFGSEEARSEVLSGVNLDIKEGEFVAIVGFSGSGKTTLVSLMAGLETPDQGTIRLGGKEIAGPGPESVIITASGTVSNEVRKSSRSTRVRLASLRSMPIMTRRLTSPYSS